MMPRDVLVRDPWIKAGFRHSEAYTHPNKLRIAARISMGYQRTVLDSRLDETHERPVRRWK